MQPWPKYCALKATKKYSPRRSLLVLVVVVVAAAVVEEEVIVVVEVEVEVEVVAVVAAAEVISSRGIHRASSYRWVDEKFSKHL